MGQTKNQEMAKESKEKVKCEICGKDFSSQKSLKIHIGQTHKEKPKDLEKAKEKPKDLEKVEKELILIIPLKRKGPRTKRTPRAIRWIRKIVARKMHVSQNSVKLQDDLNKKIWSRGIGNAPSRVRISAKLIKGEVKVSLA